MSERLQTPTDNPCVNCGRLRSEHRLANFADGPWVGEYFLVCPTNVYVERAAPKEGEAR